MVATLTWKREAADGNIVGLLSGNSNVDLGGELDVVAYLSL